jgi:hypothetical protein
MLGKDVSAARIIPCSGIAVAGCGESAHSASSAGSELASIMPGA